MISLPLNCASYVFPRLFLFSFRFLFGGRRVELGYVVISVVAVVESY